MLGAHFPASGTARFKTCRAANGTPGFAARLSLVQDRVDLILVQDREILAVDRHLVAAVLAEQHLVAGLDAESVSLAAVEHAAVTGGDDAADLRLLLGAVGQIDAGCGFLFLLHELDDNLISEWFETCHVFLFSPNSWAGL